MSDRTQLAIGRNSISVPRITKRLVEAVIATGLTSLVAFAILVLNIVLTDAADGSKASTYGAPSCVSPQSLERCF